MHDWRGAEIKVGARVIYTSHPGTSAIAITEAVVIELTPKMVKIREIRRKEPDRYGYRVIADPHYLYNSKTVRPDLLTVVDSLPGANHD